MHDSQWPRPGSLDNRLGRNRWNPDEKERILAVGSGHVARNVPDRLIEQCAAGDRHSNLRSVHESVTMSSCSAEPSIAVGTYFWTDCLAIVLRSVGSDYHLDCSCYRDRGRGPSHLHGS